MTDAVQEFDEYAGLTEEEIAALKEIDEEEAGGDGDDVDVTGAVEPAAAAPADGGEHGEPKPGDDAGGAEQPVVERRQPASAQADADEKLADLAEKETALLQRFEAGEIETRDYAAEVRKLSDERFDIKLAVQRVEIANELAAQQNLASWNREVAAFFERPEHQALKGSQEALDVFDVYVRRVTSDPASAGLTHRQQLEKAHALLTSVASALVKPAAGVPQPEAPARASAGDVAKGRRTLPPTLAHVPAAAGTETDDGRFAALDRLAEKNPEAHEQALEKLSDADRETYLSRG